MTQPTLAHTHAMQSLGIERLSLLGKHSQVLMAAYLHGEIDEAQLSERALRQLVHAHIVYQPDDTRGFILRPNVSDLIASMVADENRRHVHSDVADKLETIRVCVLTLREAQRRGDVTKADLQLQRLTALVHDLAGQFGEAIDSLWHRLNSNFGFVSSLSDKIRENERAQKQITRLLDGLNLVDFDMLIELGEGNVQLRKLLVSQLQRQLSAHHSSLLEVQKRLVQLMVRFREQQARSVLIANMAGFLREHTNFVVGDYAYRHQVPDLINQAKSIRPAAAVSLDSHVASALAAELLAHIPRQQSHDVLPSSQEQVQVDIDSPLVAAREQALKADVEAFMLHVIDCGQSVSALEYLTQQQLDWDPEVWLFQVLGEYQGLHSEQRQLFMLQRDEHPMHRHNQVMVIEDLRLNFHFAA